MNATHDDAAARARADLDRAGATSLGTDRDRRIHGFATAGFGLVVGAFIAANRLTDGHPVAGGLLAAAYVLALLGLAAWQKRSARTVPRHSRNTGYAGLAGTMLLAFAAITWLNVRQDGPRTAGLPDQVDAWWVYVVAALVTALPMLVAGHLIHRGRR